MKYLSILLMLLLFLSSVDGVSADDADNSGKNLLEVIKEHQQKEYGLESVIIQIRSTKLKNGDYIQLKGYDTAFKYIRRNSDGYIYLDDGDSYYGYTTEKFNSLYMVCFNNKLL